MKPRSRFSKIILVIIACLFLFSACSKAPSQAAETSQSVTSPFPEPTINIEVLNPAQQSPNAEVLLPDPTATSDHNTQLTPTPDLTVTPSTEPNQATALSSPALTAESPKNYPDSHYIKGVTGHKQVYYLGCEASASVDWANYFGTLIYESTFQSELPISDNPDLGYVGIPTTRVWGQIPPYAYGVHSDPIADLLVEYGLPAVSKKGYTLDEVKRKLSESKPIIVWIIGNMEYSKPVEYIDKDGGKSIVAPFEHVVILTGYNEESVRYMSNGRYYDVPNETFLTSWGVLGNMAVIHE